MAEIDQNTSLYVLCNILSLSVGLSLSHSLTSLEVSFFTFVRNIAKGSLYKEVWQKQKIPET